ncbi:hypothetical protein PUMCH_000149 [Australozyma saopauloensis]|uniref:RRM domain-containing protein n=1 Tax=Australozyma saopauloensis TaxID=291208 RepID=A0AAX4H411_9ASCO|nr:hypothetical protein PUMCH_000149 [[Candida] saopauloensis]
MSEDKDRIVYISSLPFDYSEEQVAEIAKSVGPISDLKLIFDSATGRSKGSAYVQYADHETALSAVRNLNNANVGTRYIRCSLASDSDAYDPVPEFSSHSKLPPLPLGIQVHPSQNPQQVIAYLLSTLDLQKASELLKEARTMSLENPQLMKKLLDQYPQLSHALVETSMMINVATSSQIELCLNRQQPELDYMTPDHVDLLVSVNKMSEEELAALDEDQVKMIKDIKNEISKGSYGIID